MVRTLWILCLILLAACSTAPISLPTVTPSEPVFPSGAAAVTPTTSEVFVYFLDEKRYNLGIQPFEVAVTRTLTQTNNLATSILQQYFLGPTPVEYERGLRLITSGFSGLKKLRIENGVAHVYMTGACQSGGATYTIAQPIQVNLRQVPGIQAVKVYDAAGSTEDPAGPGSSIPFCLEP